MIYTYLHIYIDEHISTYIYTYLRTCIYIYIGRGEGGSSVYSIADRLHAREEENS